MLQRHLNGPALAPLPAGLGQQVGRRGEGGGRRAPDVRPAGSRGVHRGRDEGGGLHLGLAHRARPRATQLPARGGAGLEDLQASLQLALRPAAPARIQGRERGQRARHVHVALVGAEPGLHRPDRHQDIARHAVGVVDGVQLRDAVAPPPPDRRYARGDVAVHVVADRQGELRLPGVVRQHPRIGREPAQQLGQQRRGPAGREFAGVEPVQPLEERRIARRPQQVRRLRPGHGGRRDRGGGQDEEGSAIHGPGG